jgi:hypothetical protein
MDHNININVHIGNDSTIEDAEIANVDIHIVAKPLSQILTESYGELVNKISEIQNRETKRELLRILDTIKDYFIDNIQLLERILEQVNCKLVKSQEKNIISLFNLLSFLVVASYTNNSITVPNSANSEIKIKENRNWFFNAADISEISLAKHISKISDYIYRTPDCNITNGNCYIAQLLINKHFNFCNTCNKGILMDKEITILPNIIDSVVGWQEDFFELRHERKLIFKCGKCTTDISQYEFAKEIMEEI